MSSNMQVLDWDTDFFGFGVCRIQSECAAGIASAIADARQAGMRLAYWFVEPGDTEAAATAKAINARLVDQKITYLLDLGGLTLGAPDARIESAAFATPQLRALAVESGHYSRYKVDPGFDREVFEKMYNIWLERSVSGAIAREVLAFTEGEKEVGFVTLGVKNGRANIGLIAVDSAARGAGIGAHLLSAAVSRAREWGCDQIDVVTQKDNAGACRFYERFGFAEEQVVNIYHVWL